MRQRPLATNFAARYRRYIDLLSRRGIACVFTFSFSSRSGDSKNESDFGYAEGSID